MKDVVVDKTKYNDNYIKYLEQLTILNQLTKNEFFTEKESEDMRKFLIKKYKVKDE